MIFILTALTEDGRFFIPAQYSRDKLSYLRKSVYTCAECKERVILKVGRIKVPHFAHYHDSSCGHSFSEGESTDHLNGKIQLYNFLQNLDVSCNLEPLLTDIIQRPDIFIHTNRIALEFQCSKISPGIIQKRNLGYQTVNIQPLWILKTPNSEELPFKQIGAMKISSFQAEFLFNTTYGKILITYCPQSKSFTYISNFLHLYSNHFVVKVSRLPINDQSWPLAKVKQITEQEFLVYLRIYQHKRMDRIKNLYFYNRKGIQSFFLQVCYKWRIMPEDLPLFIGVPSLGADTFGQHACEWQLQWIDYVQDNYLTLDSISDKHFRAFLFLHYWQEPEQIVVRLKAIKSYVEILLECIDVPQSVFSNSTFNYPKMHKLLYRHFLAKGAEN